VKLLLDEMVSAVVADQLRDRGFDVVAVQDPDRAHLRGIDDCVLLDHATEERRVLVTDNVPDLLACHRRRQARGHHHYGLLFFTNATFPRHRHELFVRAVLAALDRELRAHPDDDGSSWIRWLEDRRERGAQGRT
jgi:predicted nuclease of predicted toxin-antitoxin system